MKIKIRKGIFETNSSSMHSIVVVKEPPKRNKSYYEEEYFACCKKIRLYEDDMTFERYPFKILLDPYHKLGYVLANILRYKDNEEVGEILDDMLKMINNHFNLNPPIEKIELPTSIEDGWFDSNDRVYDLFDDDEVEYKGKDNDGQRIYVSKINGEVLERGTIEADFLGTIDHQSSDVYPDFMAKHNVSIEQFIFDPHYIVIIDGDEYCIFNDMARAGLINTDNILINTDDEEYSEDEED